MSSPSSHPVVRPALPEDLAVLQELARPTIDARYRPFLGNENVDWFINSGASDEHVDSHFRQGHIHCMEAARVGWASPLSFRCSLRTRTVRG
ncbi:hypothetical protein ABZO31_13135 [Streptomyces sp. HUAS MG47]|uniref:hypothetical protein n=1 Tax=Streptomyces solicamelliae TaxID=3231716 RepID=UPI003877BD3A